MQFSNEQIQKTKQAKSTEELLKIAKENGIEMTEKQAKSYFAELNKEGELSDDELEAVAGGKGEDPHDTWYGENGGFSRSVSDYKCPVCGAEMTFSYSKQGTEKCYNIYTCDESGVSFQQFYEDEGNTTWFWSKCRK